MAKPKEFFDKVKDMFKGNKPKVTKQVRKQNKSDKEIATEKNEPYVNILGMTLDPKDISNGAIELDWNDKFISELIKAGYTGKTDADVIDQWFTQVCRNIVQETYEQEQADPAKRTHLGGGYTEYK